MRILLPLLLAFGLSACIRDAVPRAELRMPGVLAIVGVTVIPMTDGSQTLADRTLVVRNGRISQIGARGEVSVPRGARIIEGKGRYLMPGLADMHVHLEYVQNPNFLNLFLKHGVTTVRSMDGRPYIRDWRDAVAAGRMTGPRIVTAGPILDGAPPARDDNLALADADAGRRAVAEQANGRYDFLKVYTNLSAATYAAIVEDAKRRGLRVAGHVPRGVPLAAAARDLWSIEHLGDFGASVSAAGTATPGWARRLMGAPIDPERLAAFSRELAGTPLWVVPTAIQKDREVAPPALVDHWVAEEARDIPADAVAGWRQAAAAWSGRLDADDWKIVEQARRNRLAVISAFHRAGVKLAIGTDTPNPFVLPGASVHLELANFVAAGLSPAEALRAATLAPAQMLGLEREQGTVEIGKRADLLLLGSNPLLNVAASAKPIGIVLAGRWLSADELKALPANLAPIN
jgi:imidazolonepropionase-like amidohydrolase